MAGEKFLNNSSSTKISFQNSKGRKLSGILTKVDKEFIVIICHGYPSDKNGEIYQSIQHKLSKAGISSLRFDFSGQGESEGEFKDFNLSEGIDDLESAIKFSIMQGYKRIRIWGCSFGGMIGIQVASRRRDIDSICLVAPVVDYKEQKRITKTKEEMKRWKEKGFIRHTKNRNGQIFDIPYSLYENSTSYDGYNAFSKIKSPVFIIHGDMDKDVPVCLSEKAEKLNKNSKLAILEGADHHFKESKQREKMFDLSVQFFKLFVEPA